MYNTAIKLLNLINDSGFKAYIVGGYPRDLYLNRPSTDIDICTSATPKDLKEILGDIMLPNEQYGSITVVINKIHFEITTFRKESKYKNNRVPTKVKYINDLSEDLLRRDFTINTICMDSEGTVIDLLNGKKDLDDKLIKMVGNPRTRLKEDALRILRAIRFATILDFRIDPDLKKYIKKYGHLLKKLSYYRKKEELDKIFSSTNVEYGINLIKELKLDQYLELSNINKLNITSYSIGIWAQLDVTNKYNFSKNELEMIKMIKELNDKNLFDNEVLYNYGLYLITISGEIKGIDKKQLTASYNSLPIKSIIDINIRAKEICELLNKHPGPFIKEILNNLKIEILNNRLENDNDKIREYISNIYKKESY